MKKLTIIFSVCMAVIFFTKSMGQAPRFTEAKVYFIDRYMQCLIPVTHKIPKGSAEDEAAAILDILIKPPDADSGFISHIKELPAKIKIKGETAYLSLTHDIADAVPDDRDSQKLFLYQVVNSLCSLPEIEYIKFSMDSGNTEDYFTFIADEEIFSADYSI